MMEGILQETIPDDHGQERAPVPEANEKSMANAVIHYRNAIKLKHPKGSSMDLIIIASSRSKKLNNTWTDHKFKKTRQLFAPIIIRGND